jgi:hypothetical protein
MVVGVTSVYDWRGAHPPTMKSLVVEGLEVANFRKRPEVLLKPKLERLVRL